MYGGLREINWCHLRLTSEVGEVDTRSQIAIGGSENGEMAESLQTNQGLQLVVRDIQPGQGSALTYGGSYLLNSR